MLNSELFKMTQVMLKTSCYMLHTKHFRNKVLKNYCCYKLFTYEIKHIFMFISILFISINLETVYNFLESNLFSRLLSGEVDSSHYQSTYLVSEQPPGHHLQNQLQRISEL